MARHRSGRLVAVAVAVVVLVASGCGRHGMRSDPPPASPEQFVSVDWGGRQRTARLHVPIGVTGPVPMVVQLHGGGGNGTQIDRSTGFTALADREAAAGRGFVVVSPDAVDGNWNDGRLDQGAAVEEGVDDVGFLVALTRMLVADALVDPAAVVVVGMSNGAFMAQRVICEAPAGTFAGAGLVAGTGPDPLPPCTPTPGVRIVAFHGTDDPLVPYDGGDVRGPLLGRSRGAAIGVDALAAAWAHHLGAPATPERSTVGEGVTLRRWVGPGGEARFYRIDGGGHRWPGGGGAELPERLVGGDAGVIDATTTMWSFLGGPRD